jgi:hypothetical protein
MPQPFDLTKLRASLPLQQQLSFLNEPDRVALLPHTVKQSMLSEDALRQQRFCQELQERLDWIAQKCSHPH